MCILIGQQVCFHLRSKTCFLSLHSLVNRGECLGEFESKAMKTQEFSQTLQRFSTGCGGTDSMFYFFYKNFIFRLNKEKVSKL